MFHIDPFVVGLPPLECTYQEGRDGRFSTAVTPVSRSVPRTVDGERLRLPALPDVDDPVSHTCYEKQNLIQSQTQKYVTDHPKVAEVKGELNTMGGSSG